MASLWSRAISALHQVTVKSITVIGVSKGNPAVPLSYPFQNGDKFNIDDLKAKYLIGSRVGDNGWYYPLTGTLYVSEEHKIAVYGGHLSRKSAVRTLHSFAFGQGFVGDAVSDSDVDEYIVLANGKLLTPEQGALIQNDIRRQMMEKFPDLCRGTHNRKDRIIQNSIDHILMLKYYQEISPLFNLRQSGQPLK